GLVEDRDFQQVLRPDQVAGRRGRGDGIRPLRWRSSGGWRLLGQQRGEQERDQWSHTAVPFITCAYITQRSARGESQIVAPSYRDWAAEFREPSRPQPFAIHGAAGPPRCTRARTPAAHRGGWLWERRPRDCGNRPVYRGSRAAGQEERPRSGS